MNNLSLIVYSKNSNHITFRLCFNKYKTFSFTINLNLTWNVGFNEDNHRVKDDKFIVSKHLVNT